MIFHVNSANIFILLRKQSLSVVEEHNLELSVLFSVVDDELLLSIHDECNVHSIRSDQTGNLKIIQKAKYLSLAKADIYFI